MAVSKTDRPGSSPGFGATGGGGLEFRVDRVSERAPSLFLELCRNRLGYQSAPFARARGFVTKCIDMVSISCDNQIMEQEKPKWRPKNPGRKLQYGEKTTPIRCPVSLIEECKQWIKEKMKCKNS